MLSIQPLKSAQGAADYYSKAFNYYAGDSEALHWLGQGSQILKLSDTVQKEQMLALLEGKLPDGKKLSNREGEHRPGFDMTFSAPKSVSILVGLGIAPELVKFHDEAVQFTIGQLEKEFAETRVSRQGEIFFEKTGNLIVAAFRQPTSRANDPALHTHCVTMNITFHEGRARSLASDAKRNHGVIEQIQSNAHYCGQIYRNFLANKLKEANFPIRLVGNGLFEIEGIPEEIMSEFSSRRKDILDYMANRGLSGAKNASVATVNTRNYKEEHDLNLLKEDWKKRAKELGFDADSFMKNRAKSQSTSWISGFKERLLEFVRDSRKLNNSEKDEASSCIKVAIETLSQRTSIFSERLLAQEAMKHSLMSPNAISHQSLVQSIQQEIKNQTLYETTCPESGIRLLTTPWLLTLEVESIARIEQNKGAVKAVTTQNVVKSFQKERNALLTYPMTNSQKESMKVLLTSQDRYLAIQGFAGVAKTSMLSEAKHLIESKGFKLRGVTVASSAAHELQEKSGIKTDVFPLVHQELKKAPTASLAKTIFITDEASMLSSHQGHELIKQIERVGARLVLVGDKAQLPSVNAGRIFGLTQEYGIKTTVMDEIVRQKNETLKKAVMASTKGNVQEAIENLEVKTLSTHEERIAWIASHWLSLSPQERDKTLLFAPTHANREEITSLIRNGLKQEGVLNDEPIIQTILKTKSVESIQQRFVSNYHKGNRVRFNQDFKGAKIKAGNYYTVAEISKKNRQNNVLPLIDERGNAIKFKLDNLPNYKTHTAPFERIIEVYEAKPLELRVGDKVMWTRNFKTDDIRNGLCATVKEIKEKSLVFLTKEGQQLIFEKLHPALKHLDYSYVLTNYKVQGKDAPYGIGLMESYHRFGTTLNNFYVQISRAIQGMTLVTDNKEELVHAIQKNSMEKPASLDIISSQQLLNHESRFSSQQISLHAVIEKRKSLEKKIVSQILDQQNNLHEHMAKKNQPELNKELEL
ncbi:MobF family relaxase [Legionella brunensis]|uniref:Conjugative transfer protein TraI n=1 Tax=Legionella brunensis TaxID=29422 RepID=A0A0W0SK16_9GAMM|nr:MobF family relaxase [Legionella brunensis]KTC83702.1 conjugative transfer protein TraI [Legionella brunensis]